MSAFEAWLPRLRELGDEVRRAVGEVQRSASASALSRPAGEGVGDVTFALDVVAERAVEAWLERRVDPLSLLSEDHGWRHRGGEDFDHGGPRIAIDPIDGTRPLMAGLRSAWVCIGLAPPGQGQPRLRDLSGGLLVELPLPGQRQRRTLWAERGGPCWLERAEGEAAAAPQELRVDPDDRCDHGLFCFFHYHPRQRVDMARIEQAFFARLEEHEGAELRACYPDLYCSSAGQLALLALGTYRFQADLRAWLPGSEGAPLCKPYDLSGALVVAEAAGVVVHAPPAEGHATPPLDAPLDARTPLAFLGYANAPTAARLGPHLLAAIDAWRSS